MPIHAVTYAYTDDAAGLDAARPAHREFLGGLARSGVVIASGPLAASNDAPGGALILVDASVAADALAALAGDPFFREGLVATRAARTWSPVIGELGDYA